MRGFLSVRSVAFPKSLDGYRVTVPPSRGWAPSGSGAAEAARPGAGLRAADRPSHTPQHRLGAGTSAPWLGSRLSGPEHIFRAPTLNPYQS